jgi:hypothetical protein
MREILRQHSKTITVALLTALGVLVGASVRVARWVGTSNVTLQLVVLDGASGNSLDDVSIVLAHPDLGEFRSTTDHRGQASFDAKFRSEGVKGVLRDTTDIDLNGWTLHATKGGYSDSFLILEKSDDNLAVIGAREARAAIGKHLVNVRLLLHKKRRN